VYPKKHVAICTRSKNFINGYTAAESHTNTIMKSLTGKDGPNQFGIEFLAE
jgi:hypothetical protein